MVAEYAVAFVAIIEGVEIVPAALIVVVAVAPKAVEPKKFAELAKEERVLGPPARSLSRVVAKISLP
jgi:hypothetical protein